MDADLFKPADAAALLAIRAALDGGTLRRDELVVAFQARGLIPATGTIRAIVRKLGAGAAAPAAAIK